MEEWRQIHGFEGYEASVLGRVRSWKRQAGAGRLAEPRIKATSPDKDGYLTVSLMRDGKQVTRRIAHLVLLAFVGSCPDGMEARHLNGNAADNRLSNLAWSTHLDNIRDKYEHGTMPSGDAHWSRRKPERRARGERRGSKLNEEKVRAIRLERAAGATLESLGAKYGVDHSMIARIERRKAWAHVS